jgi:hypothetical protein
MEWNVYIQFNKFNIKNIIKKSKQIIKIMWKRKKSIRFFICNITCKIKIKETSLIKNTFIMVQKIYIHVT